MQFISGGPDLPDELLQAHEEGRVVFFCGAGISYPAGLPGFKQLVCKIYSALNTNFEPIEKDAFEENRYDATLGLLERRHPDKLAMRRALEKILEPNLKRKNASKTHKALLQLARSREGSLRLVTTNFDRIFERLATRHKKRINSYVAPHLPIPKATNWDGLVYLHGLLPKKTDNDALKRLVVTSGDFGLAYLTERWAARFATEMFRNFVVCFIGYSINDPVLRYMMDALAADRMHGERTFNAYAFGDYRTDQMSDKIIEWEAKGVIPILYNVPGNSHDHSNLHKTIHVWSETYRDGILGKESIVGEYALARPSESTKQDDYIGRMLWAIADKSGLPAKHFAEFNPVPPLEWLDALDEKHYKQCDLPRFGIMPLERSDPKLSYSLTTRPSPYTKAPFMRLVSGGDTGSDWDIIMFQIGRWLVRHLDDSKLLLWIAENGGQLHKRFSYLIEAKLDKYARLKNEGKEAELEDIRSQSPKAIPGPRMTILWRMLLTDRVVSSWESIELYRWMDRLKRDGLTTALRLQIRSLLEPKVLIKRALKLSHFDTPPSSSDDMLNREVAFEVVLSSSNTYSYLINISEPIWAASLPSLITDFQTLLLDALYLFDELGQANSKSDKSFWDMPSISTHWQNRGYDDWVVLIELVRDAWLSIKTTKESHAKQIAIAWLALPYPTFKRLALFAASQCESIKTAQWVDWLQIDNNWWLWSECTKREVCRLLATRGRELDGHTQERLEAAILSGPPSQMYLKDIAPLEWHEVQESATCLRLAKLEASGLDLGRTAIAKLEQYKRNHPNWNLPENQSDEFSIWISSSSDPEYEERYDIDYAPRKRREMVKWLLKPVEPKSPFYRDTWRDACRNHPINAGFALQDIAALKEWMPERWNDAFNSWSETDSGCRWTWKFFASTIGKIPDNIFTKVDHALTWWLERASSFINQDQDLFYDLVNKVLQHPYELETGILYNGTGIDRTVTEAINHPIGRTTKALINFWLRSRPSDNDGLPERVREYFELLCDTTVEPNIHGRVILASRLIPLFRVDNEWTHRHLLPIFDWSKSQTQAAAAWRGFLWSPRLYRPLLLSFKDQFLKTANYYHELGQHGRQYVSILTFSALEPFDKFQHKDYVIAFENLPQEALNEAANALVQALDGASGQRENYWNNRILPFWNVVWPKSEGRITSELSEPLSRLCIAAGNEFPSAISILLPWLRPFEHLHYSIHKLHESGLCSKFPENSLKLLSAIIYDQPWGPRDIEDCLNAIKFAEPKLKSHSSFQRLLVYSKSNCH